MAVREKIDSKFLYFYDQGKSLESYNIFGAHLIKDDNGKNIACEFCLYAPNAKKVEIVGEWNYFTRGEQELFCVDPNGVWYAKLIGDYELKRYKYCITTKDDKILYKSDPYGFYASLRPLQDSVVYNIEGYKWNDDYWMFTHPKTYEEPMLIYEMHLGSWKKKGLGENGFYTYKEIAPMLINYLKNYGYTHVELMPVYEHPLDASWGYQGVGYYAITSRYGTPKDFMYFVDMLHQAGIGIIMDWVPGHICKDAHGLYMFDGSYLYEYGDENIRENKEWGTANLDLGKGTTKSFLYSNALFYMKYYHIDGFRVDAVSNLIYYHGNPQIGTNTGACEFLRELSVHLFTQDDRVILSAEDSSAHPYVTLPAGIGGLGFNYKWDMGWMNDTLKYFKLDPIYRKYHHNQLTFSMAYFYNEQFMLPLSHDEVVHMKGSLLNKMPGDQWQQFANYKTLIGYMLTHPGKKLLFMGDEMPSYDEWHYEGELPWEIRKYPNHDAASRFTMDMTNVYKNSKALWQCDYKPEGFMWLEADNCDQSLYVYARFAKDKKDHLIIVMNCTPNVYHDYEIGAICPDRYIEVINSDKDIYGGSNQINLKPVKVEHKPWQHCKNKMRITVPPLGIVVLKPIYKVPRAKKSDGTIDKQKKEKNVKKAI